ncbi:MAG: hypothetical protein AAGJ18_24290 [Bacteroidota bacterium]
MKSILVYLLIPFFLWGNGLNAAKDSTVFQLVRTIPVKSTYLTVDNLYNLYVATEDGQIRKYNEQGVQQFDYNNYRYGAVGKIDVRNPLNILVYYPELASVVILDRTLSEMRQLNLFDLDLIEPKAVAIANDNNLWIFDQVAAILRKVNQEGATLFESRNLNQLTRKNLNPAFLQESNNLIYLSDAEQGLFVFDAFGQLKQQFPIHGMASFQVIDKKVIYRQAEKISILSTDNGDFETLGVPFDLKEVQQIYFKGNTIYVAQADALQIYQREQ